MGHDEGRKGTTGLGAFKARGASSQAVAQLAMALHVALGSG